MKENNIKARSASKTTLWYLYLVSGIMLAFTGFGQMPLYKRYYIADIPGMAWSADFYITHQVHYIFAIILFGIVAYAAFNYLMIGRRNTALTRSGYVRSVIIAVPPQCDGTQGSVSTAVSTGSRRTPAGRRGSR